MPATRTSSGRPRSCKAFGVKELVGAHCTGIEAVYRIRELAGLTRQTCMVGAVGASYSLDKGINPLRVAK